MAQSPAELLAASAWKLHQAGQLDQAIEIYRRAAALAPGYAEIHNNLGNALRAAGRLEEGAASLKRAAKLKPSGATFHTNLGLVLTEMGQYEEAAASHRRALKLQPGLAEAHNNLGIVLVELGKLEEAIASFGRAVDLKPDFAEAYANLGGGLRQSGRSQESAPERAQRLEKAIVNYRRAIDLKPDYAEAHCILGDALGDLGRLEEAAASLRRAIALKPGYGDAFSQYVFKQRSMCDWRDTAPVQPDFLEAARSDGKGTIAFAFLIAADEPAMQLEMARHDCRILDRTPLPALWQGPKYNHPKIRLAYLSSDLYEHAMGFLLAELFERHDRSRFELYAFSFGPNNSSPMSRRLAAAFDHFIDVRQSSDYDTARQIRAAETDIAVDLMGHTKDARPRILSYRPAPIQVNYLGYPGSMGAGFIDYAIVDPFVVPPSQQVNFDEKLVHLPECYQVNDSHRPIAERTPSRADCGLPEGAFVFCCFNNNYKLTPTIFDIWMRLLKAVPGSVLWLLRDNEWVVTNLRREARSREVDPERLIFAPRVVLPDHLARHRLAHLFLDTLPYNAHTTASDALWAGLPVLTCAGIGFQARVAGSLLRAVGLPELVARDLHEYEEMALRLATRPVELTQLREKLARNRLRMPLFDTDRFRRHIEAAYTEMWSIWQRGEQPRTFAVPPVTEMPSGGRAG